MLTRSRHGQATVVRVAPPQGALAADNAAALKKGLADLTEESAGVILDLEAVTVADSAGVGALLALHRRLERAGGRLVLCRVQPAVRVTLEMLRVDVLLRLEEDVEAAARRLAEPRGS